MKKHLVVLVTVPAKDIGESIARALLNRGLAACVNIIPSIVSLYVWDGDLCADDEALLIIKTSDTAFQDLSSVVKDIHPYDVPEIIALPIAAGSQEYLGWIEEVVRD